MSHLTICIPNEIFLIDHLIHFKKQNRFLDCCGNLVHSKFCDLMNYYFVCKSELISPLEAITPMKETRKPSILEGTIKHISASPLLCILTQMSKFAAHFI